jgi:hypothetical protein
VRVGEWLEGRALAGMLAVLGWTQYYCRRGEIWLVQMATKTPVARVALLSHRPMSIYVVTDFLVFRRGNSISCFGIGSGEFTNTPANCQ